MKAGPSDPATRARGTEIVSTDELRTPLARIIGAAEGLLNVDAKLTPEAQRATAEVVLRNARMLLKHLDDLRDGSKLEAGKLENPDPVVSGEQPLDGIGVKPSRETLLDLERTRRHVAEAANRELQAHSQKLSELFQQAPGFMVVLRGPTHVFELANAAFFKVVGARDLIGRSALEAIPEVRDQGFIALLDRVFATGEPFVGAGMPVLLERQRGAPLQERIVDFVFQPLFASDGGVAGIFIEGSDVTDRKRAEDALRVADRRKDEFLATLAHELRNPLAPIRHAAMISKSPHATEAQLKWSHDVIDRQVGHMARLLDDLLEVSRITGGTLELRKERVPLKEGLVAAVETARPLIEARGHELTIELPDALIHVDADPVRLAQILTNLLTNAAKYTDRGGSIGIEAKLGPETVDVIVRDNGIGISPELLPHVFDMFSQATTALERSEGGLGIGLSLVRALVLLHGGSVDARSAGLGQGSEFVVSLPLASDESGPRATARARDGATRPTPRGVRILVADDNRDNADSCALLLQMAGHEVRIAYSGGEALTIAAQFRPRIALLDLGMPEVNGYEVARAIRASEWGEDIVLVAVTGWSQLEDRRRAEAAGFDHHLAKPVDFDALKLFLRDTVETPDRAGDLRPITGPES